MLMASMGCRKASMSRNCAGFHRILPLSSEFGLYLQSLGWCLRSLSMFWSGCNSEIQDGLTGNITPWKTVELFPCWSIPISGNCAVFHVSGHIFLLLLLLLAHGETSQRFFAAAQPLLVHASPFCAKFIH